MVEFGFGVSVGVAATMLLERLLRAFSDAGDRKERMTLFDKALTQGDGARLYNLRVAEGVTQDKRVVQQAVKREITPMEAAMAVEEPWSTHPDYVGCDVVMDLNRRVACIVNENAADGPDYWEEPLDEFMGKFEEVPSMPDEAQAVK